MLALELSAILSSLKDETCMTDRDQILAALRQQERPATHPPAWRSRRAFADLAERFTAALSAAAGEVTRASSLAAALDALGQALAELQAARVAVDAEPPLDGVDLAARWPAVAWHIVGQTPGDLRAFCVDADAGLSSADAALAETGTLVVASGPGKSRMATLLPPVHIALVPTSRLTADLFTWTAGRGASLPANVTLISGPSKTADIEQTMAIGVHGPKRLIVILYEDEAEG